MSRQEAKERGPFYRAAVCRKLPLLATCLSLPCGDHLPSARTARALVPFPRITPLFQVRIPLPLLLVHESLLLQLRICICRAAWVNTYSKYGTRSYQKTTAPINVRHQTNDLVSQEHKPAFVGVGRNKRDGIGTEHGPGQTRAVPPVLLFLWLSVGAHGIGPAKQLIKVTSTVEKPCWFAAGG